MSRCRIALAASLTWAALGLGCVMPDQLSQLQRDVVALRQQMQQLEREQRDTRAEVATLHERATDGGATSREELADLTLRVDRLARETTTTDQQIRDLNQRLDRVSQDLHQTREIARRVARPPVPPPDGALPGEPAAGTGEGDAEASDEEAVPDDGLAQAAAALPDPEALYNTAYADFSKGNFALAISGFEEYQQRFPDSALADNALYWIGECHFSQGSYPAAIDAFDRLLDRYPRSDKLAAADLKKGLAYMEQNQVGQAIVQLRYVVSNYPRSDEARIARDKLSGLGSAPD